MDSNHRKNTLTELQSVPFSHSGTPPVFFTTTHSFCVLMKECAKVIVFFIMSKSVPKKNRKKLRRRKKKGEKKEKTRFFNFSSFSPVSLPALTIILSRNLIRQLLVLSHPEINYSYHNLRINLESLLILIQRLNHSERCLKKNYYDSIASSHCLLL